MKRLSRTDRLLLVGLFLYDALFFIVAVAFFNGWLDGFFSFNIGFLWVLAKWAAVFTILLHAGYKLRLTPKKDGSTVLPVDHRTQLIRHYVQWGALLLIVFPGLNTSYESMVYFAIIDAIGDIVMTVMGIRGLEKQAASPQAAE